MSFVVAPGLNRLGGYDLRSIHVSELSPYLQTRFPPTQGSQTTKGSSFFSRPDVLDIANAIPPPGRFSSPQNASGLVVVRERVPYWLFLIVRTVVVIVVLVGVVLGDGRKVTRSLGFRKNYFAGDCFKSRFSLWP